MTFAVSVSTIIQSDSSSASASASATPSSKTWFREKYLIGSHDIYYEYTLHRFQLGDNDHDMCPDIHKTATLYAIIGRYLHEVKHTCSSLYVQKNNQRIHTDTDTDTDTDYTLLSEEGFKVIQFIFHVSCYTFEIGMIIMSILLAACSTLFMIILLFCQY